MSLFDVPPPWQERAECLPIRSGLDSSVWDCNIDGEEDAERNRRHQIAASVCGRCPVGPQCEADARAGRGGGVRNGLVFPDKVTDLYGEPTSIAPRRYVARRADQIVHGRPAGYKAHRRLDVPHSVCEDACRLAWNADNTLRRAAARAGGVS